MLLTSLLKLASTDRHYIMSVAPQICELKKSHKAFAGPHEVEATCARSPPRQKSLLETSCGG
jgi:hypothetical protein